MASRGGISFTLGPLSHPIPAVELEAWVAAAEPGDRKVYCEGVVLAHNAEAVVLARALYDDGLVTLVTERNGRAFRWIAQRRVPELGTAKPIPQPVELGEDEEDPDHKVFRLLKRKANLGQVCPANIEIARECGLKDADAASWRMRKLAKAGAIRVVDRGPILPRVVTIIGTGKSTAKGAA